VARTQSQQGVSAPDVLPCVPVAVPGDGVPEAGSGRMVRSGAASRLGRLLALCVLLVAGWALGVLLGWAGAAPAAADARVAAHHPAVVPPAGVASPKADAYSASLDGSVRADEGAGRDSARAGDRAGADLSRTRVPNGDRRSVDDHTPRRAAVHGAPAGTASPGIATMNAEAMAGRGVDGLTSQYAPGFPAPSTAEYKAGANGLAPQPGGGSGPFGPGLGDVVRSIIDPRLMVLPAPPAAVLPPVVRTAADDPSFSPD
jgi:hypothetical protein